MRWIDKIIHLETFSSMEMFKLRRNFFNGLFFIMVKTLQANQLVGCRLITEFNNCLYELINNVIKPK